MNHNIAVLLSGNGSNLKAIIDKGIKVILLHLIILNFRFKDCQKCKYTIIFLEVLELEKEVLNIIIEYDIKLLVLAGYMRLLSQNFVNSQITF